MDFVKWLLERGRAVDAEEYAPSCEELAQTSRATASVRQSAAKPLHRLYLAIDRPEDANKWKTLAAPG